MQKIINLNLGQEMIDKIENLPVDEFIKFAKDYNIFQVSNSKSYDRYCDMIKARLEREGLSVETVRPE